MRLLGHIFLSVALQWLWDVTVCPQASPWQPLLHGLAVSIGSWQVVLWLSIAFFAWLDKRLADGRKLPFGVVGKLRLPPRHTEIPFSRVLPIAVRNQLGLMLLVSSCYYQLQNRELGYDGGSTQGGWFYYQQGELANATGSNYGAGWLPMAGLVDRPWGRGLVRWLRTVSQVVQHYLTTDLLFYTGHRLMHSWRPLRATHALHHSSWATSALSGYYVSNCFPL